MFSEKLVEPVSDEAPSGGEAIHTPAFQQLTALTEYLGVRLEVLELERDARRPFEGENAVSEEKAANESVGDGRRKLARFESAVKELTGRAARPESVRDDVRNRAEQILLESSKDLRAVQSLALAWLLERGVEGFQDSLRLIVELIDRFGEQLHPRPDEDDPTDFVAREIVVSEIFNGESFIAALRETTILDVSGVGRFSFRDADVMDGKLHEDVAGGVRTTADIKRLAQALASTTGKKPAGELAAVSSSLDQCLDTAAQVLRRMGPGASIGDRVIKLMQRGRGLLEAAAKELVADGAPQGDDAEAFDAGTAQGGGSASGATATALGPLRNRDDARRQILQISRFLESTEPSNPAPFFLRRAERLLGAPDFFAIMRDMAPNSIGELEHITGHRQSSSETQ